MTWDYKILAHKGRNNILFKIHEVYYDENGNICDYAIVPAIIEGESMDDILFDINGFKRALNESVLWAGNKFPEVFDYDEWSKKQTK
jgi:hypothetical protein